MQNKILFKLALLIVTIFFINNSAYSQSKEKYKLISIDSTALTYYYIFSFKKVRYNYYYTVLSEKGCTANNSSKSLLKVGDTYSLSFSPMDRVMDVWKGIDSVYFVHVIDDIKINNVLLFSKDRGVYPNKSNEICGKYFIFKQ